MKFDWSEQSPHIRTLYHPWHPGDGYDEATIQAAEARLGLRLPATLRTFYRVWGRREELTQWYHGLLAPKDLVVGAATLVFCVENQAVSYWGIRRETLEEANPPVVLTHSRASEGWEVTSELAWTTSHAQVSGFLDDLAYFHAFCPRGAIHGGWGQEDLPAFPAHQSAWLEEHWNKATVTPLAFGLDLEDPNDLWPTLHVRDGQALRWSGTVCVAAREAEALDEIGQQFQIRWAYRW